MSSDAMTDIRARRERIESIFNAAADAPADQRPEVLAARCGSDVRLREEVESLLAQFDAGTLGVLKGQGPVVMGLRTEQPGDVLGRYRLVESLGEGGFGLVFIAEQSEPVRRMVALKVLKAGMDTKAVLGRFEAERQALAMMDHPSIAKVLDAGSTPSGRPFFVMELVRGEPFNQFCDHRRLTIRERLQLFVQVCQAVQHAHQKGIIHRDLKPSNILVADQDGRGLPKVIDFGIAKALHQPLNDATAFTAQGQIIGTPEYMSPEQAGSAGHDVDTRTDVYSLGVLLYELATGALPFDSGSLRSRGLLAMQQMIRDVEPPKPSTRLGGAAAAAQDAATKRRTDRLSLVRGVRGELEWIILKAMEKERARRYDSVALLIADIESYLSDKPVSAGPPSSLYRTRKFVKRNIGAVAAASAVGIAVVAGGVASTVGFVRASEQRNRAVEAERVAVVRGGEAESARDRAELEAAKAKAVSRFLQDMLASVRPSQARGREVTVKMILDEAAPRIAKDFENQPALLTELQLTIGATYRFLERIDEAERHVGMALETRRGLYGESSLPTAEAELELAHLVIDRGRYPEGVDRMREILRKRKELGASEEELAQAHAGLGRALLQSTRPAEAEKEYRQALRIREALKPGASREVADLFDALGRALADQQRRDEALEMFNRALAMARELYGEEGPRVAGSINSIASLLHDLARYKEAEAMYKQSIALSEKIHGRESMAVAQPVNNLAILYQDMGEYEAAEKAFTESLEIRKKVNGFEHPSVAHAMSNIAGLYIMQTRFDDAEPLLREALSIQRRALGPEHQMTISAWGNLAACLERQRNFEDALQEHLARNIVATKVMGPAHRTTMVGKLNMSVTLTRIGLADIAEGILRELISERTVQLGPEHPDTLLSKRHLASALLKQSKIEESEAIMMELCAIAYNREKPNFNELQIVAEVMAAISEARGRKEEAEMYRRKYRK